MLRLDEASVKIRTGPPDDGDSPDAELGLWAGELPLTSVWGEPVPDPALPGGIRVPGHVSARAGTVAFPAARLAGPDLSHVAVAWDRRTGSSHGPGLASERDVPVRTAPARGSAIASAMRLRGSWPAR